MNILQDRVRSATTGIEVIMRRHCRHCDRNVVADLIRAQLLVIEQALYEYAERSADVAGREFSET